MLIPINENVIAGEGAQPLSLLKVFNSTRDPNKKRLAQTLTGFRPACPVGRVSFACEPI